MSGQIKTVCDLLQRNHQAPSLSKGKSITGTVRVQRPLPVKGNGKTEKIRDNDNFSRRIQPSIVGKTPKIRQSKTQLQNMQQM